MAPPARRTAARPADLATTGRRGGLSRPFRGWGRGDDGVATLELTVLFPVVLLILFGVIQGALYFHGRNVAMAAAEQGVRAARADGQTNRAGTAADQTRQFLADTGELDNLTGLSITPNVGADTIRVTVSGRTVSLLPGVPGPMVSQTASGVIEQFTTGGNS
jgi:Flp pilus assembly protein TadG